MGGSLSGKHVVITGATGGLGQSVVQALLDVGATVHVPCYEAQVPAGFSLATNERVRASSAIDLTDEEATRRYYAGVPPLWASVHVAGGFSMGPVVDTSLTDLQAMWRINCVTSFLSCREATRSIRTTGEGGRIVNIAARPALIPVGGMVAYSMAKSGVVALTQALAEELRGDRILVNAVVPSVIDTPANRAAMPDADFDSWPKASEIAEAIARLVSVENTVTSGALVPVYGDA